MIAVTNQYQNDKYDNKKTVLSGWKFKLATNNDRRASNHKNIQLSKNLSYSHESIFHLENGFHIQVLYISLLLLLSIAHCYFDFLIKPLHCKTTILQKHLPFETIVFTNV